MEKDYLGISSTVLVSLLFGLALVLVNSWFNRQPLRKLFTINLSDGYDCFIFYRYCCIYFYAVVFHL